MRDLVSVLAEPNRRRLLELLVGGERSAGELAAHFGVTRSAISQHLGVLARAGLVDSRKDGRHRFYRLVPEGMAELRASLDVFWSHELEELAAVRPGRKDDNAVSLEKSVVVPLDPDETFALLTEPERLRRWHAVTARIELRAGGEFRWTIVPGHTAAGTVREVEPGRRLVLGWGWEEGDLPPGASTLTITLQPAEGGTLVRLVHEGLTDEQAAGHGQGWDHYLARLEVAARAGDAGADEWAAAPDPMDRLSAAEASLAACQLVLRGLGPSDAERPSPCASFTVHQVVEHLLQSLHHLGAAVGARSTSAGPGNPEVLVADAAQAALEAWRARGSEGMVSLGSTDMPAEVAAAILALELLVHAWDVATATGQAVESSDALSEYVLGLARQVIAPPMRNGDRFAAEVSVGADAGNLERLVAYTGRTP